jgi:predicted transcriptional regulator
VKVREIQSLLNMEVAAGAKGLDREVAGGYCGDLLSDVMANSTMGGVWLTIQSHQNIVAVGVLRELAAIILVNGRRPDEDTKNKADEEGIPLLLSPLTAFRLAGRLYEVGIGRERD